MADYQIKLQQFEGPLDLLLQLIQKNKLEITEVSLSEITDQFIGYLEKLENLDPEELSDFLVIATKLLLIKSKALLPDFSEDEEVNELEQQLKIFKEFFEASKDIEKIIKQGNYSYFRPRILTSKDIVFSPPENLLSENLRDAFVQIIRKIEPIVNIPQAVVRKTVSLEERLYHLRELIDKAKKFSFTEIISNAKSKGEVIVNFLALLELVKERKLLIKQKNNFGDIIVKSVE